MSLVLVATVIGLTAHDAYIDHQAAHARAEREALNASKVLVEHTARTFEAVSRALDLAADVIDDDLAGRTPSGAVHSLLKAIHGGSPVLYGISFVNSDGDRVHSSRYAQPPPLNSADQEYFSIHANKADVGLYISSPAQSRISDEWIVVVSRRVNDAKGQFAGIINAIVRQEYFADFYRSIDLGLNHAILLARADGMILAREPELPEWNGRSLAESSWFRERVPGAAFDVYRKVSPIDGVERISGHGVVPGLPLVITASMSVDSAMAAYYARLNGEIIKSAAILAAIIAGAAMLMALLRRQDESMAVKSLLANVVESSSDAIVTRDGDGRITSWNAGAVRIFGYTPEEAIGQPVAMLVPPDRTEEHRAIAQAVKRGESTVNRETVRHRKDGTAIDVSLTVTPLFGPNDGAVIGASSIARDISDRKRSEAETEARRLEAAEKSALLKSAFTSMNQGVGVFDRQLRLAAWNEQLIAFMDLPRSMFQVGTDLESILRAIAAVGAYGDVDKELAVAERMAQTRLMQRSRYERRLRDGKVADVQWTPMADGYFAITYTDVTEQKHIEDALRESQERQAQARARLADAIESLSDGFILWDAQDRLVLFNEAAVKAHAHYGDPDGTWFKPGVSFAEMMERRVRAGLVPAAKGRETDYIRERIEQHRNPTGAPVELHFDDGHWELVRERRTREGGVVAIRTDITLAKQREAERREAMQTMAEKSALLESVFATSSQGVAVFDQDLRLVAWNEHLSRMFHDPDAPLQRGTPLESRLRLISKSGEYGDGDCDRFVADRMAVARSRRKARYERRRRDGTVIDVQWTPLQNGYLAITHTDITSIKQREIELAAAREAADAANLAKSEFLSRMSHELRTPLNAVIGFAQMLVLDRPKNLTPEQKDYGYEIEQGGRHLLALVNEVLDLARVESGRLTISIERVSVAGMLESVGDTMASIADKANITLAFADAANVPDVCADDLRLRQVLINLLSNAIKYNRAGGSVSISAIATPDGRVRFIVSDTGIGIALEHQKEVFTPFNRGDAEFTAIEGTGIGLSITKRLVEAMDGTIGFTSHPGLGSTFWFELPIDPGEIIKAALDKTDAAAAQTSRATVGGYSLLYVEDNPVNLRLMEHLISTLPDVVLLSASSARMGLDLAVAHRPNVIVLDLNMPELNGFEVLARLRSMRETADIPVLALTAAAMPHDIQRGLAAGFYRYLTKPLDVKAFLAAVDAALDSRDARAVATA